MEKLGGVGQEIADNSFAFYILACKLFDIYILQAEPCLTP
jgi:hypothetical protein